MPTTWSSRIPLRPRQRIRGVMDALNQTIQDIRRYIFDLRAAEQTRELEMVLEEPGPGSAAGHPAGSGPGGHRDSAAAGWAPEQVSHVTQIAREALSNVVQHAGATHVTVSLSYLGNATRLTVADDGQGMAPNGLWPMASISGQGMANMQARARMLGGRACPGEQPGAGASAWY